MSQNREFDLIVTIVDRGSCDCAVEAAKRAGAHGATVFYARGTGIHEVESFFGIRIQPEKEVMLSLVHHDQTKEVMQAIMKETGLDTPGRGIAFVLPVEDVAGTFHGVMHGEEEK